MSRLLRANRVGQARNSLTYIRYLEDFRAQALGNVWSDTGTGSFTDEKIYVVQSGTKLIQRCILMTTDPGNLVLDPTCGSGTTAYVAEQWVETLDHHRHIPRGASACPRPHHGRPLPLLPARRQSGGPEKGSRTHPQGRLREPHWRRHSPRIRLRARAAHYPQVDCQQRRDRRHMGTLAGNAGAATRRTERCPWQDVGGVGDPPGIG